jgi:hypothetical protein
MNQKGLTPILIILIMVSVIVGYFVYQNKTQVSNFPQPSENPWQCIARTEDNILLEKESGKVIFKDLVNGYQLDVTPLPEIQIQTGEGCINETYEIEIYKRVKSGNLGDRSVARFSVNVSVSNKSDMSLVDYAKQIHGYQEGKHIDPNGENYGRPFTSSPIVEVTTPDGTSEISWSNVYTEEPTYYEGTTASKDYLLKVNDKIIHFEVISWDMPSFKKATSDFDKIIKTFKFIQ